MEYRDIIRAIHTRLEFDYGMHYYIREIILQIGKERIKESIGKAIDSYFEQEEKDVT